MDSKALSNQLISILSTKTMEYIIPKERLIYEIELRHPTDEEAPYHLIQFSFEIGDSGEFKNYQFVLIDHYRIDFEYSTGEVDSYLNLFNDMRDDLEFGSIYEKNTKNILFKHASIENPNDTQNNYIDTEFNVEFILTIINNKLSIRYFRVGGNRQISAPEQETQMNVTFRNISSEFNNVE